MAHEISHAFQQYYGHPTYNDDELESEKFTDALALYLGFTNIYKNGQKYKVNGHIHRLGYFSDNSLRKVDEIQSTRLIKEKPMREYKQKFDGIQNKASQTIEGIKIYLKTLENTISLINPEKPEYKTTVLYYKKKYLEADFLRGCELFVYNLIKYTEEEANERIKIIEKSLLELSEDIKTLEKLAD